MIPILVQDLRHAARSLRRSPGYAAAAILILALGIGASAAIFSVTRAVLLRPLPYREPERLAWVWATRVDRDRAFFSIPNFLDTAAGAHSFESLAAFTTWNPTLSGDSEPEPLSAARVTGNAFPVLGAEVAIGRALAPTDAEPQAARVAVLSHGLWQRRFGGDPAVLGRPILLNGDTYLVVGVMARGFLFPGAEDVEAAVPISLTADARRQERGSNFLRAFGRLVPGADAAAAQAELAPITERLRDRYPDENGKLTAPRVLALEDEIVGGSRRLLVILAAAVGLLLAVACANISALALVRGLSRRPELAVRKALGAGPLRLVAPLFSESILIAAAGAAAGVLLARELVPRLLALAPAGLPRAADAVVDGGVLAFATVVASGCALLFGLVPAAVAARVPAAGSLGHRSLGLPRRSRTARSGFVLAQVALSLALLAGAALFARSFARLTSVSPGFDPDRVLSMRLALGKARYPDAPAVSRFLESATESLAALPGVEAAGAASVLPLSGMNARQDFEIVGRPPARPQDAPGAQSRWVDAGYFTAMRIPLRTGRAFTTHDDGGAPDVVVVDEPLAKRLFPDGRAVGARLRLEDAEEKKHEAEIVGVVGGVKHFMLEEEPLGTLYLPAAQIPENMLSILLNNVHLVARTRVSADSSVAAVRRAVRTLDPDVPTGSVRAMDELRGAALATRRFTAVLCSLFGLAAALLAAVGLYGTLAQLVAQDRRPIGIRLALGATRGDILRQIARRGVRLALAGIAVGLAVALPLARLAGASLYGVSAADPLSFAAASALLLAVSALASTVPARRASRIDPMTALRAE